jgi:hypothetical protein
MVVNLSRNERFVMVQRLRAAVCLMLLVSFVLSGRQSLVSLAVVTLVVSLVVTFSVGRRGSSSGAMLVVLRSCRVVSHEVHEYGCDADIVYESCKVHDLSSSGAVKSTVTMGGDAKRVALFLQGENTTSEWFSKIDKSIVRDLSNDELRGAVEIILRDETIDITLGMEPDGEDSLTLYSVSVESDGSKLQTARGFGDYLSDKREPANR